VELRRALLLFAIVLGLAAIATSLSRPNDDGGDEPPPPAARQQPATPTARPGSAGAAANIVFRAGRPPATEQLAADRPASVTVEVDASGLVELGGLGLTAPAEPLTPARFDVLVADEGRHPVRFTPAGTDEPRTVGTLVVGPANTTR
jgi:hypothetical protein